MAEKFGLKRVEHLTDTEQCSKSRQITDSTTNRISQLPESIIHNILSFLSTKDVVRARVLSKTWQCMCSSFPMYDFSDSLFGLDSIPWSYTSFGSTAPEIRDKRERFMNFVNSCLLNQCERYATIQRFRLSMSVHDDTSAREDISIQKIEGWIELAVQNHVQELDLFIQRREYEVSTDGHTSFTGKMFYWLPPSVLSSKSLKVLRLSQLTDLTKPFSGNYNINLPSLRVLSLNDCTFDDQFIGNLSISCPMLEDFALIYCNLRNVQLSGFQKLKICKMYAYGVQKIEIAVPSLQILHCIWRLQEYALSPIKISCPCLENFSLFTNADTIPELVIETPILHSFDYRGEIPSLFSIDAPTLQKLTLDTMRYLMTAHDLLEMREFLRKFSRAADCLNLRIGSEEVLFIQKDVKDILIPGVESLQLEILFPIRETTFFDNLIDGLFWNFQPKSVTIKSSNTSHDEFIKVLYEKLMRESDLETCCKSWTSICWRHSLKDFQIEGLGAGAGAQVKGLKSALPYHSHCLPLPPHTDITFLLKW